VAAVKALICGLCGDIQALQIEWRSCKCGNVEAHWTNGQLGLAEFRCWDYGTAFLLGLNNTVLAPALRGQLLMNEDWREAHEQATDAPGYIFDKSKKACWAVIVRMGTTADVKRADDTPPIEAQ
jgi:hypothetical protein